MFLLMLLPASIVFPSLVTVTQSSNAAPEWQARSLWWRSIELMVACPLKGLVSHFLTFMMQRSQYHLGDLLLGIKVLKGDARM